MPDRYRALSVLAPFSTLLLLLGVWELACKWLEVPVFVLPAPTDIAAAFVAVEPARWLQHLAATLRVALSGFMISLLGSIPLAILLVRSKLIARSVFPILVIIQATPVIAIAPLLIVLLGTGEAPRLVITCLITFFPLVISATTGLLATPPELLELSRCLRRSAFREIWHVRLPSAVPHIFSGMRVAITLAIIGAVVAEFVAAEEGLGYFLQLSTSFFEIPQAFAALVFLSASSLVLFKSVELVQYLFFRWSLPR